MPLNTQAPLANGAPLTGPDSVVIVGDAGPVVTVWLDIRGGAAASERTMRIRRMVTLRVNIVSLTLGAH